jgi:threonine dehydratase
MPPAALADVYRAHQVVRRYLPPTPLLYSDGLSRRVGCEVYIKYENMSPIRSFKARGALYCLSRLAADTAGVACASTGNHGQGVALAAQTFQRPAVVVVPTTTTEQKMAAIRRLGAELHVVGNGLAESVAVATKIAGGLATTYPCRLAFPFIQQGVDEMVLVDVGLAEAALIMLAEAGHLPEGAGAAGLAALLADPVPYAGQKVVLVLTGGNFEPDIWNRLRGQSGARLSIA